MIWTNSPHLHWLYRAPNANDEYENLFIYHKCKLLDCIKDIGIKKAVSSEIKLRATSIGITFPEYFCNITECTCLSKYGCNSYLS